MSHENLTQQATESRETYLAEVGRALQDRLSTLETYEGIEDLRAHLLAMATAYEELGFSSDEAMRCAIRHFGKASRTARTILDGKRKNANFRILGDPLGLEQSRASFIAFMSLNLIGTLIGGILAELVGQASGVDVLSTASWFVVGGYASCIVTTLCWSLPKRRPIDIGVFSAVFSVALTLLIACVSHDPITRAWLLLFSTIGGVSLIFGWAMAHIAKRLRAHSEQATLPAYRVTVDA